MPTPLRKSLANLTVLESPREVQLRTWLQMVRTVNRMERRIVQIFARHDLTLPQFDVLATLRFSEGVTQQELAERLLVTKGNVTGLINRLEECGFVERRPDAKDARANRLHLTAKGRAKVEAVIPEHDALVTQLFGPHPIENVSLVRQTLADLERAAGSDE